MLDIGRREINQNLVCAALGSRFPRTSCKSHGKRGLAVLSARFDMCAASMTFGSSNNYMHVEKLQDQQTSGKPRCRNKPPKPANQADLGKRKKKTQIQLNHPGKVGGGYASMVLPPPPAIHVAGNQCLFESGEAPGTRKKGQVWCGLIIKN